MKATINETGMLTVQAQSELESYALDRWADNYFGNDEAPRKSVLMIQTTVCRPTSNGAANQDSAQVAGKDGVA